MKIFDTDVRLKKAFEKLENSIEKAVDEGKEYIPAIRSSDILIFNFPLETRSKRSEEMSKRELLREEYLSNEIIEYICRDRIYVKHEPSRLYYHTHVFDYYTSDSFARVKKKIRKEGLIIEVQKARRFNKREPWEQNLTRSAANYGYYRVKPGERNVSTTPIILDVKTDPSSGKFDDYLFLNLMTDDKLSKFNLYYIAFTFVPTYFHVKKDAILQVSQNFSQAQQEEFDLQLKKQLEKWGGPFNKTDV